MSMRRVLAIAMLSACAPLASAQDAAPQPPTQAQADQPVAPQAQPEPGLILRELLVLQTDRYDDTANNPKLIQTVLPANVTKTGRSKKVDDDGQYATKLMPLGLITFEGELAQPMRLRLTLPDNRDRFHAHWPSNGQVGAQMIEWPALLPADADDRVAPTSPKDDWLAPLRSGDDRLWFQSHQVISKERFLLYDASIRFKPAIDLDFEGNAYRLKSLSPEQAAPPLSVLLRSGDAGWSSDALAAPWPGTTADIATKAGNGSAGALEEALTPIKDLLQKRGYNAGEIELALGMIASAGLDQSAMSLIYVMPVGVIDQHIDLKIKPRPDQITRTTIVVVNNVDPEFGSQINALLDDLGSDEWAVRERAHQQLLQRSNAAIKKIQQLKDHEDPEVAFRARQILQEHDWKYGDGE